MALADIYDLAARQAGYFTAAQARAEAGWKAQHLNYHTHHGNVERLARGLYRLSYYPRAEDEELILVWLRSDQEAVFSHQTALALLGLSDLLLNRLHITLPLSRRKSRAQWPDRVVLHFADLDRDECTWVGNVPATTASRTLRDCAMTGVRSDEVRKAVAEAQQTGLVSQEAADEVALLLGGEPDARP